MRAFLSRFRSLVLFVLSGFDRLRFCGESRLLNHALGVQSYLYQQRILFKDFPRHAEALTKTFRDESRNHLGLKQANASALAGVRRQRGGEGGSPRGVGFRFVLSHHHLPF